MMKIHILYFAIFLSNCSYSQHEQAINEIKSEKGLNEENDLKPFVSSELISFNSVSVFQDVISERLGRKISFQDLNSLDPKMLENVNDSLFKLDQALNMNFKPKQDSSQIGFGITTDFNSVIFLSELKNNLLYAEVIYYNKEVFKSVKRDVMSYGKAYTFLFEFDEKGELKKTFKGITHNN